MYCINCGHKLQKDALYCDECGARVPEKIEPTNSSFSRGRDGKYQNVGTNNFEEDINDILEDLLTPDKPQSNIDIASTKITKVKKTSTTDSESHVSEEFIANTPYSINENTCSESYKSKISEGKDKIGSFNDLKVGARLETKYNREADDFTFRNNVGEFKSSSRRTLGDVLDVASKPEQQNGDNQATQVGRVQSNEALTNSIQYDYRNYSREAEQSGTSSRSSFENTGAGNMNSSAEFSKESTMNSSLYYNTGSIPNKWKMVKEIYRTQGISKVLNLVNIFKTEDEQYRYFMKYLKFLYAGFALFSAIMVIMAFANIKVISSVGFVLGGLGYLALTISYLYIYLYIYYKGRALILFFKYVGILILCNIIVVILVSIIGEKSPTIVLLILLALFIVSIFVNKKRWALLWKYKRFLMYFVVVYVVNTVVPIIINEVLISDKAKLFIAFYLIDPDLFGYGKDVIEITILCLISIALYFASNYLLVRWIYVSERKRGYSIINTTCLVGLFSILILFNCTAFLGKFFNLKEERLFEAAIFGKDIDDEYGNSKYSS